MQTFSDILDQRADTSGDRRGFTFLVDGERTEQHLTYGELRDRALAIGNALAGHCGERVLLLYPPGLEYVAAFFGCIYAGAIAVPAYPPDPSAIQRTLPRLRAIARDAGATIVLTTAPLHAIGAALLAQAPELAAAQWIATDTLPADPRRPERGGGDIAFLQYTSGSTSDPKGVIVTHANLLANSALIHAAFGHHEGGSGVIWLPPYHDMGLIGGILQPLYAAMPVVLMSPLHFLQRPRRWLDAISRYRATTSGGPNFAYELCIRKTTPAERSALDLSSWRVAFDGAEPIRPETLRAFADAFAPAGFRTEAFHPCYGLAEATLIVTGGGRAAPFVRGFAVDELERGRAIESRAGRELVGCGRVLAGTLLIVDPASGRPCAPGEIGEVWLAGDSVASGYFGRAAETAATFRARTSDGAGPFLRTGDLGVLHEAELIVVGREKDLLIVRGRNHHPHDIERTIEARHDHVRPGCGAAFAVTVGGEERLVVVFELDAAARERAGEIATAIWQTVLDEHELVAHEVVLIEPRSIPKTSSGKIQRRATRAAYLAGELAVIARSARAPGLTEIRDWLIARIAATAGLAASDIDVRRPLAQFGLGSLQAVELSGELERWLGRTLPPTLAYEYPTIERLAVHLAGGDVPADAIAAAIDEPIAIVGIGCRFPGAADPAKFFANLCEGVDSITTTDRAGLTALGGYLPAIADFDPARFGISPREAAAMDPQQRLVLDVAWDALEDAGLPIDAIAGTPAGVFLGMSTNDYGRRATDAGVYGITGNALSIAANRVSYALDLAGPSLVVDTACSSSLVAVHLACESLRRGEATLALAGGVNVILDAQVTESLRAGGFLARDGRCKTFDAAADGYVRGEGCGVVVLAPLSRALERGDRIYAVIRGSAVGSDGKTNGLTAPSGQAQRAVVRRAYAAAGVDPRSAAYVELHGTGTPLGDPIEARALAEVVRPGATDTGGAPCRVGSVKTNIGHLEAAAGIAGLIKTALALHHGTIPPSLHFTRPNPAIAFDALGLAMPTSPAALPDAAHASVSSFGFGGTNAHVVLAAPAAAARTTTPDGRVAPRAPAILAISAHDAQALARTAERYAALLDGDPPWAELCGAAAHQRAHLDHRLAVVADSASAARDALRAHLAGAPAPGVVVGRARRASAVFVFGGQGTQWPRLGYELYGQEEVFRAAFDACDHALGGLLAGELATGARLGETAVAQPVLFAIQVALAALWRHWGVVPAAVVGHSMGEVAAAHVAGALSLRDAAAVIHHRSRLMQRTHGEGRMAVVELPASALVLDSGIAIAAENSERETVISGDPRAIAELAARVPLRELPGAYAFHSAQMEPLQAELAAALADLVPQPTSIPLISTVTGERIDGAVLGAAYWAHQLRAPVRFAAAIRTLTGHSAFVEIGAPALARAIELGGAPLVVTSLRRGAPEPLAIRRALAALHVVGHSVNWTRAVPRGARIDLPHTATSPIRCWIEPQRERATPAHPVLGAPIAVADPRLRIWETELEPEGPLRDHRAFGATVVPAAWFVDLAFAATGAAALEALAIDRPLVLDRSATVQIVVEGTQFRIASRAGDGWIDHVHGRVAEAATTSARDLAAIRERCIEPLGVEAFYQAMARRGLAYGPRFRGIAALWRGRDEAIARVAVPASGDTAVPATPACDGAYDRIDPALLDACAQLLAALEPDERPFLPIGAARVSLSREAATVAWAHVGRGRHPASFDVTLFDATGEVVGEVQDLAIRYLDDRDVAASPARWLYRLDWQPRPLMLRLPQAGPPATWIVLADRTGVADAVIAQLTAAGARCVRIDDPARAGDLAAVIDELGTPRGVLHLWSLDATPDLEGGLALGVRSALAAIQAIGPRPVPLWLVTRGAQGVDQVSLAGAALWGLGRTLAQEQPAQFGGLVDLVIDDGAARQLVRELTGSDGETQVAYRGETRTVARLVRDALDDAPVPACRIDGAYLITGGLGALGLRVARSLVDRGARRIILLGRTALPPRAEWARLPPGRVADQVAEILRLEALGATLELAAVDVGDADQLHGFFARYRDEQRPPIRAVFHAAGVLADRTLAQLDPAQLAEVFRAKAIGAWLLDRELGDTPLVLFSSIAGVLGAAGQASYAAANALLDALAQDRQRRGLPALAIAWGPWAEIGVAARIDGGERLARTGMASLDPDRALDLLHRLIATPRSHVVAAALDWQQLAKSFPGFARTPLLSAVVGERVPERAAATHVTLTPELIMSVLHRELAAALGAQTLDLDQPLDRLGVDSLMGIELRARLEAELGVAIPMDALLARATVRELARRLLAEPAPAAPPEVIAIRAGSRAPVFCLHPGALDPSCYAALAERLPAEQAFHAIRIAALDAAEPPPLDEIAAQCAAAIRAVQPSGPYRIAGWSLGGIIALEVARRLEHVALLAIFDAPAPEARGRERTEYDDRDEAALVPAFASYLAARDERAFPVTAWHLLDETAQLARILAWAHETGALPQATDVAELRQLVAGYARGVRSRIAQLVGYRPEPCAAPIVYFRARDTLGVSLASAVAQWRRWSTTSVRVIDVPGDHYSMFVPPQVDALAAALAARLTEPEHVQRAAGAV